MTLCDCGYGWDSTNQESGICAHKEISSKGKYRGFHRCTGWKSIGYTVLCCDRLWRFYVTFSQCGTFTRNLTQRAFPLLLGRFPNCSMTVGHYSPGFSVEKFLAMKVWKGVTLVFLERLKAECRSHTFCLLCVGTCTSCSSR